MYDLTGMRFGKLRALFRLPKGKAGKQAAWHCLCDCGNEVNVLSYNLRSGHTKSCGCVHDERMKQGLRSSHGLIKSRLYSIWENMKSRCYNPNTNNYKYYGARGISICPEWKDDFQIFYDWAMANGYSDELSIDRIDVDGNYEPSNCRWADDITQANNKRCNR